VKALQLFSDEALKRGREMSPDQILKFLEDFRSLHASRPVKSRLISMKVPEDLLAAFKTKASMEGSPYQTKIKQLMKAWLKDP